MDFEFTPEQEHLKRTFREFLEAESSEDTVRAVEAGDAGVARALWRKMAEVGMIGLALPEAYGGAGAGMRELAALYEEGGRVLWPVPHLSTAVLGGFSLLLLGSEAQRAEYLPRLITGQLQTAFAFVETSGDWLPEGIETTAVREGDAYRLNGRKLFVKDTTGADLFLVCARTNLRGPRAVGLSTFLVPANAPGLSLRTFPLVSGERQAELTLEQVVVPVSARLGREGSAWADLQPVLDRARVCLAAQMAGATDALLEKTVEYTKQRVTFGRPLASNQVIHHRLADVYLAAYGARYQSYYAAWLLDEGLPASADAALAKAFAAAAYRRCTDESMQMHGGYGFATEFYVQLYWRRMRGDEVYLGDSWSLKDLAAAASDL